MAEEKLRLFEEGIAKAKVILDGYTVNSVFSAEEYMKYYDCVYFMCCNSMFGYSGQLLDRFKKALEESISSKVLPSLIDKNGVPLLIEHLHLWANYKITQDRNGVPVDRNLLQGISTFYVEVGAQGKTPYYDMFEEAIFADAATYYSQLASQWHLCYSSTNYVFKVEQCLIEEKGRASQFLDQSSLETLLQVVHSRMIEHYADKLTEKQKAENMNSIVDQAFSRRIRKILL